MPVEPEPPAAVPHDSGPTTESTKAVPEQSSATSVIAHHPPVDTPASTAIPKDGKPESTDTKPVVLPKAVPDDEAPVSPASLSSNKVESGSQDRDLALANVVREKSHSHIRAWEDNEKAKSSNKFHKVVSKVIAWENSSKAKAEAQLKIAEEKLEKKRAALVEKMKNGIAATHRAAEDRKANAEARKAEEFLRAEELAAKHRALGKVPKKLLCFSP